MKFFWQVKGRVRFEAEYLGAGKGIATKKKRKKLRC